MMGKRAIRKMHFDVSFRLANHQGPEVNVKRGQSIDQVMRKRRFHQVPDTIQFRRHGVVLFPCRRIPLPGVQGPLRFPVASQPRVQGL